MSFTGAEACFSSQRVLPVITAHSLESGLAVARVLFEAGLRMQEITLRTTAALPTIAALSRELPQLIVGAGTVLNAQQGEAAIAAGARFLVSPGCTAPLLDFAAACAVPFIPGIATVSEAMSLQARGATVAKLFPAQVLGGVALLKALASVLPALKFCPTGGIDARLAPDYLKLPNVLAVGGSWMVTDDWIEAQRWGEIRLAAEQAAAL